MKSTGLLGWLSLQFSLLAALLVLSLSVARADTVESLLQEATAPEGVVFEVASGNSVLLETLLPALHEDIRRLRLRFPELDIALVSHGKEQFILSSKVASAKLPGINLSSQQKVQGLVQQLVQDKQLEVHVCGTYAEWNGYEKEDFPDYINVAAAGPVQINDYIKLGYRHVRLP